MNDDNAYRVRDWANNYETAETRKLRHLQWVPVPNKHDGAKYRRVMAQDDPGNLLAAFMLILQVASRCPTRGVLADSDGPLTPDDLHFKTGLDAKHFVRALDVLSSPQYRIGWIDAPCQRTNLPEHAATPAAHAEPSGANSTEQKGREKKRHRIAAKPTQPVPEELRKLSLYAEDKKLVDNFAELLPAWKAACPGIDVMAAITSAHAWELANPAKRKHDRPRFLYAWLKREQDRRGGLGTPTPPAPAPQPKLRPAPTTKLTDADILAQAEAYVDFLDKGGSAGQWQKAKGLTRHEMSLVSERVPRVRYLRRHPELAIGEEATTT